MSRLAIATADGVSVCTHLARSAAFFIIELAGGREVARTIRWRGTDTCGHHQSFVELLEGCGAVICGGIGDGAYRSLQAGGIEPLVLAGRMTVEAAVKAFVAGTLATTDARVCLCAHP